MARYGKRGSHALVPACTPHLRGASPSEESGYGLASMGTGAHPPEPRLGLWSRMRLFMPLERAFSLSRSRPTRLQAQRPATPASPVSLQDDHDERRAPLAWPLPWRWPVVLATAVVSATVLLL